ncbi:MAG: hypothetical protein ACOC7N_05545 [Chloroflexota bacterium]
MPNPPHPQSSTRVIPRGPVSFSSISRETIPILRTLGFVVSTLLMYLGIPLVGCQALRFPEGIRTVVILMLCAGLFFVPFADRRGIGTLGLGPLLRWIGVLLFGLASALDFWSGVALGRLCSGVKPVHATESEVIRSRLGMLEIDGIEVPIVGDIQKRLHDHT